MFSYLSIPPLCILRYKEVNTRLRKLLAEERRSMLQVRANYQNEVNSRTELEMLLRDCVEEVRREGERRCVSLNGCEE